MPKSKSLKKILFIMDPLSKLDVRWDNSLALAREFGRRRASCWTADVPEVRLEHGRVWTTACRLKAGRAGKFATGPSQHWRLDIFDLVLIRKEPPFDFGYYALTLILEHAAVPIANHPRGIRNANEKMWALRYRGLMPETLISSSADTILRFGRRFKKGFIVKPLNEKGGRGIFKVERITPLARRLIKNATRGGLEAVVCQRYLTRSHGMDKRIVLLNGKVLCAFEKHPSKKDFRANLGLGATAHPTTLTASELKLVRTLAVPLKRSGLYLAGLDVMTGKLLEVNVTSPAGMTDAEKLYPGKKFIAAWADWLELFAARARAR